MAATHGRLTGRAGVCLTTLGPGALNLTTAAAYAHLGAMPMVMITGQKAIRRQPPGALPNRRHRRDHAAAHQDGDADRLRAEYSDPGSRRLPGRAAGAAGPCASRTARGYRGRRSRGRHRSPACRRTSGRACGGRGRGRRSHDHGRQQAARHAGRRGEPPASRRAAVGVRATMQEFRSSTPRWGRALSMPAPISIWAPPRCRSGIGFTRPSTGPI